MDLNEINENWQETAPKLAAIEKVNPFEVPENYFEAMAKQLDAQIGIMHFDNSRVPFDIPENYFESLSKNINRRIKLEELRETSNAFTIPENYFLNLEDNIRSKVESTGNKPQKSLVRNIRQSWITYVAAACITAVIGFGIYLNGATNNISAKMADLSSDEIANYLQLYSDVGDAPLIISSFGTETDLYELETDLSDAEIEYYLESNL